MENFTKIECFKCGVIFAVSASLEQNWRKNKDSFYCPNGHSQAYVNSTAEILRERLDTKERELGYKINTISRLEAEKAKLERKLKRKK